MASRQVQPHRDASALAPARTFVETLCKHAAAHTTACWVQDPVEGLPPPQPAQAAWHSLDVLDTLGQLAQRGHAPQVLQLLEAPCASCPEAILVGLADVSPLQWGPLQDQVLIPLPLNPQPAAHALGGGCENPRASVRRPSKPLIQDLSDVREGAVIRMTYSVLRTPTHGWQACACRMPQPT